MSLHRNWVALSTVDIQWKQFIRENNTVPEERKEHKACHQNEYLNGNEVKDFYLDVVGTNSLQHISRRKSPTREHPNIAIKNVSRAKELTDDNSIDVLEPSSSLVNKFLTAAQNNSVLKLKEIYLKCPKILNYADNFGWTALMCAAQSGAVDCVQCLLDWRAYTHFKDKRGRSALTVAKSEVISDLLTKYGKDRTMEKRKLETAEDIFCKDCNTNFKSNSQNQHLSSILHIFNSGKCKNRIYYGIPESNRGYQLMLRKGWNKEEGLGPDGSGTKFPIKTIYKVDRYGLGAQNKIPKVTHFLANDSSAVAYRKERQRTLNKWQRDKQCNKKSLREQELRRELS